MKNSFFARMHKCSHVFNDTNKTFLLLQSVQYRYFPGIQIQGGTKIMVQPYTSFDWTITFVPSCMQQGYTFFYAKYFKYIGNTYSPLLHTVLVEKKMIENDVSYRHSSPLPKQDLFSHPQDFLCVCLVSEKDLWYSHVLMFLAKTFGLVFLNPFVCTQKGYSRLIQALKMYGSTIQTNVCLE